MLRADDARDVGHGQIARLSRRHVKRIHAVVGVVLIGLPRAAEIERLLQHHDGGPAVFEGDLNVVGEFEGFVPGQGDVGLKRRRIPPPRDRLPVGDEAASLTVLHQLRRVSQVRVRRVTFITAEVWILLQIERDRDTLVKKKAYIKKECLLWK